MDSHGGSESSSQLLIPVFACKGWRSDRGEAHSCVFTRFWGVALFSLTLITLVLETMVRGSACDVPSPRIGVRLSEPGCFCSRKN